MNTLSFSKRLSGTTAMLVYLALIVGFAPTVIRHHQLDGTPAGAALMAAAIVIYGFLVTIAWGWCVRQQSPRLIYAYFVSAALLGIGMFWWENVDTGTGAGVGNLLVVLILQSGMLTLGHQVALHGLTVAAMMLLTFATTPAMPPDRVLLMSLLVFITNGAVLLIGRLIVHDEQAQIALQAAHRKLTEYAAQAEELATLRERNRLAREIHDNLGHYLTVVNTQIEAARAVLPTDVARGVYLLERAQTLTKEGLTEIRRSVAALRASPVEQRSLPEAIQSLIEEHSTSGLAITYHIDGSGQPCAPPLELALYRAAQEGLTNIRKHARATCAELHLMFSPERVTLLIRDNGVGCVATDSGFGLLGLQERIKLLGGVFKTESAPDKGFTLQVEVPV